MLPRDTRYRLADSPADYRACHDLLRAQGEQQDLTWPTVLADRRGIILGFLATTPSDEAVIAGPLVIAKEAPRPGIIVLHLVEAYETVLRLAGVSLFNFWVRTSNRPWRAILAKLEFQPYHVADDGIEWFTRRIA